MTVETMGTIGHFDVDAFRFVVSSTLVPGHYVLSVINVERSLTPVADMLHDGTDIGGFVLRPGFVGTPDDRQAHWRRESAAIIARHID